LRLLFVVASVDYGVYLLLRIWSGRLFGMAPESFTGTHLVIAVAIILVTQAFLNYVGIRATTILTDFSGYLIFLVSIILIVGLVWGSPVELDFLAHLHLHQQHRTRRRRKLAAHGEACSSRSSSACCMCATPSPASMRRPHTSEETRDAQRSVPRGMLTSVFWSALFGWLPDRCRAAGDAGHDRRRRQGLVGVLLRA
jgi:amino acid transporter